MTREDTLNILRDLEIELHQFSVRSNPERLDELLHVSFVEFGRSGRRYDKAGIIALLSTEAEDGPAPWSQDYALSELTEELAQITYRSAHIDDAGELSRHTLRSSLWQKTDGKWQVRFHQGTPTEAFAKTPR
jgi:hypothetical protein